VHTAYLAEAPGGAVHNLLQGPGEVQHVFVRGLSTAAAVAVAALILVSHPKVQGDLELALELEHGGHQRADCRHAANSLQRVAGLAES